MHRFRLTFVLLCCLLGGPLVTGCSKYAEQSAPPIALGREDADYLVVIAMDFSGSFAGMMTRDAKGYDFTMRVADTYFKNSIGTNNRIVIVQLSATDRALLWDGTPVQLRHDFPSATEFRDFLLNRSDPNGSRIHDGVADALEYVLSDPGVAGGRTRAALLVLSDFDDTAPKPEESERRLVQALSAFGKKGGAVGFYFLEHPKVRIWRRHLQQSGIKNWVCESEIVARPPLPSFE